ncbi:MAG TPA: hypothetical protein EYQ31_17845 [Candidatus Handelsmanbacteria bacterium]|jgi:flagellar motor switch protein FliG|nr:hypothetical protein [Candidatus Handelsmanbacteria bacterium]
MTNEESASQFTGDGDIAPLQRVAIAVAVLGEVVAGDVMKFLSDHQIEGPIPAPNRECRSSLVIAPGG